MKTMSTTLYDNRALLISIESLMIASSIFAASSIYFCVAGSTINFTMFGSRLLLAIIIIQGSLFLHGFYGQKKSNTSLSLAGYLTSALFTAAIAMMLAHWFMPRITLSPALNFLSLPFIFLTLYLNRIWLEDSNGNPYRSKVLIVGTGDMAVNIAREILNRPTMGKNVCGFISEDQSMVGKSLINPSVIGTYDDLETLVSRHNIDHVLVALQDRRGHLPFDSLLKLKMSGITVEEGTRFFEKTSGKLPVENLHPSYLIFSSGFKISRFTQIYKQVSSMLFAICGLIAGAPIMLLTAIAIKLDSPGPVFFVQDRVGKDGRIFKLIKFRSMRADAEAKSGPVWAQLHDPRITKVGQFIRKTRIDEIPQFINVLKGDMDFIGPRPERPYFVEQLQKEIPYYKNRHAVKPGITGWAQVKYSYGATVEESREKLKYDLYYIKNMSLAFDFWIIFETVKIVLMGRGAR